MSPLPSQAITRWPVFFAARLGARVRRALQKVGSITWLGAQTLRGFLSLRTDQFRVIYEVVRMQVRFTALDALPLTLLTALLLGGITLIQVFSQLSGLGVEHYLSQLMAKLVIRELGPLLVGVIIVGRSGTAIAAEMAAMRLNGEVDSLYAMGVNPIQFLLVPRILGGILSVFTLIVLFDATALLGGFLVAWTRIPLSLPFFLQALGESIGPKELAITFLKSVAFGGGIPFLCAFCGLQVKRSSTELPQAVTRAAVASLLTLFLVGSILSVAIYG